MLTVLGDVSIFHKKIIAVVGSRNVSANGRNFTYTLAKNLIDNIYPHENKELYSKNSRQRNYCSRIIIWFYTM
ncbi:MAG: hypothetical protein AB8U25_02730 [Rickettsiales endosymbiont of Dermacentor nuttalli]